jgi:hypothetical protein
MGRYVRLVVSVVTLLGVVACERTPIDPHDGIDVTAADGTPGTLKGLLFSAIRSVHGEHGAAAALDLVRPLEDI